VPSIHKNKTPPKIDGVRQKRGCPILRVLFGQWPDLFLVGAFGCPDLRFAGASFEWADIAGAAPVFLAADDLAAAFFEAAFFGSAFLARAFFGSSFDEKIPVMLSMMDIGWSSVESINNVDRPEIVPQLNQLSLMEQNPSALLNRIRTL
jgi:hypothetical protein